MAIWVCLLCQLWTPLLAVCLFVNKLICRLKHLWAICGRLQWHQWRAVKRVPLPGRERLLPSVMLMTSDELLICLHCIVCQDNGCVGWVLHLNCVRSPCTDYFERALSPNSQWPHCAVNCAGHRMHGNGARCNSAPSSIYFLTPCSCAFVASHALIRPGPFHSPANRLSVCFADFCFSSATCGDLPVASRHVSDGKYEAAIQRGISSKWSIDDLIRHVYLISRRIHYDICTYSHV